MRKFLLFVLIFAMVLPFPFALAAGNDVVVLDISGDLAAALDTVADGGTIRIQGRYNIPENFVWENHGKTITFTGGILNFTKNKTFILGDNVRFENIQLQFVDNSYLFANGFEVYVHDDVTVSGKVILYGGGKHCDVQQTNLTLMGGTFFNVYGGSNIGDVLGDVNVTIGGNFNKNLSISHEHEYQIIGGGYNCVVNGNINLTFGGDAKANYIYGGSSSTLSRVNGHINLNFTGGEAMSICGGSKDVNQQCDVYLNFTGGKVQQIFGGCEKASMTGDVLIRVTGGEVTRRIYGGCYNNYTYSGWQDIPNYVYGNILLMLGKDAKLTLNYGSDESIYAHSRQATIPKTESSHLAFTSPTAYSKHKDMLGAQDGTMKSIMGNTKISDSQHILTIEVTDKAIIQNCDRHKSPTATIAVSNGIYTGGALENVTVTVDKNWLGPAPMVEYSNNTRVGFATATVTFGDAVVEVCFFIWPPIWVCITIGAILLIAGGITAFVIVRKKKLKKAAT